MKPVKKRCHDLDLVSHSHLNLTSFVGLTSDISLEKSPDQHFLIYFRTTSIQCSLRTKEKKFLPFFIEMELSTFGREVIQ